MDRSVSTYVVTALVNTGPDNFEGYDEARAILAFDQALVFTVEAPSAYFAADAAWVVGNRQGADTDGKAWPAWVRSMSVGDVLLVRGQYESFDYAVAGMGFDLIEDFNDMGPWNAPGGRLKMVQAGHASTEGQMALRALQEAYR